MAHLQYLPADPQLVDELVCELKSKGIFDQFRKDCIADVDTRPAYQNLRQRVENTVATFLSRQSWQPDLNKNQMREKLRKHVMDGNYLELGVERIVDQVVNPKVSTVFVPKVEDLVYNHFGITRENSPPIETENEKVEDLLPFELDAVSPGSVKGNDAKNEPMDVDLGQQANKMEVDVKKSMSNNTEHSNIFGMLPSNEQNDDIDKINIPLPSEEIKLENIPSPDTSPPKVELEEIELPKETVTSTYIPLANDSSKDEKDQYFKPSNSEDDDSSSDSSLRRNMSPLTPIRNYNNENSYDAQQAFENDVADNKNEDKKEPSSFRFKIDAKISQNSTEEVKSEKKETETNLPYQFNSQLNINNINTPLYEDSSNSNNLQIDYESDANSKVNVEAKVSENDLNSKDSKKEKKTDEKVSSHKSSHRSRDSHKHSSGKDKKSKHSNSRDSKHDKSKSSKDDGKLKSGDKDRSKDKSEKKDSSRESSRHRSSHKSSHRDSKSHRSTSSSGRHSSKHIDEKKPSSSNHKDKDKSSDKSTSEKSKDSKSNSHRSDKDRKSSTSSKSDKNNKSKSDDKDKDRKTKKETDDHYSLSGRGNPNRRSTDRDSNDGSSSSKGSHNPSSSKSSSSKKDSKSSSKSESTSTSGESTSPSDKENIILEQGRKTKETLLHKPIVRIESHLEVPISSPPRLPFVPDVTIKKPKFAANLEEAKKMIKMRKFLDEEQKRMNQEAALLLEFQANVRPSMSQVYSSISGPELEFACVNNIDHPQEMVMQTNDNIKNLITGEFNETAHYTNNEKLTVLNDTKNHNEDNNDLTNEMYNKNGDNIAHKSSTFADNMDPNNINICSITTVKESIPRKMKEIKQTETDEIFAAKKKTNETDESKKSQDQADKKSSDLFEVTIITEDLSENEDIEASDNTKSQKVKHKKVLKNSTTQNLENCKVNGENKLYYFAEHEKYNAELERARFTNFFKEHNKKSLLTNKLYLINCNTYEENLLRDISKSFGNYEIVCYQRNGHLKRPKNKNIVRNVNVSIETSIPIDMDYENGDCEQILSQNALSPEKSECSFELSNDYDTKLQEMVNKTSRQEIMEIILGSVLDASPSKMPQIDYLTDLNIDSEYENNLKRKICDVETNVNNNRPVLTSNKIRKLSTDQITSTTQENDRTNNTRSKYLGKARRVGLSRPKRSILPKSPTSDKSVENYDQNDSNGSQTPNGKLKRTKIQRYDTSDLYKPKLHFLSRRNHIK